MAKASNSPKAVKRRNFVRKTIAVIAVIVLVITAVVLFFQRRVQEKFASGDLDTVLSAAVTTGSIQTTVSGSGSLTGEGIVDVEVPDSVPLDTVYVKTGDKVQAGDVLASVKASDILAALSNLQDELDTLDEELKSAKNETVSSNVTAGVSGRVKAVFAGAGDDVSTVMYEHGALALLSLDGKMMVTLSGGSYTQGQTVTVTDSQGKEYEGTVSAASSAGATVLLTDNGPKYGDTVTVNGTNTGTLEIHQPLKVTGYAGTVSRVSARENAQVSRTTTLFTLTDTSSSANYDRILSQRAQYEDMYRTLVKLYKDGAVLSPCDGTVASVPEDEQEDTVLSTYTTTPASGTASPLDQTVQFTIDPGQEMSVTIQVDETDILSLREGQTASVTVESIGKNAYSGTVTEIDTTAFSADGVTMYTAKITLDKAENMLSGMTADVAVTIQGVENALLVPADAVHKTSTSAYVYTAYDTQTKSYGSPVEVTVGMSDGDYTEITSGLKAGDVVYYTEKESDNMFDFIFGGGMGGMGGMPGNMPSGMGGTSGRRK